MATLDGKLENGFGGKDGTPSTKAAEDASVGSVVAGQVHIIVQRCMSARLLIDAALDKWSEIGRGLVLFVSFSRGEISDRAVEQVAKSVLTAPLSSSDKWQADHSDAESVIALCRQGESQSLLVVPQASLVSKLEPGGKNLKYHSQSQKDDARRLYERFVAALASTARELICGRPPVNTAAATQAWAQKRAQTANVAPNEYFKVGDFQGKYSRFDDRGVPTHDESGDPLAKSAVKKLEKLFAAHSKKYEKAAAAAATSADGGDAVAGPIQETTEEAEAMVAPAVTSPAAEELGATTKPANEEPLVQNPVPEGSCLPEIRHGTFGGRQGFEMRSAGPFTHAFVF
eukprot:TRINITY_DN17594_c0_g1_i1.p1 TRINITY_DN17594_c0_g1~~TRINITY_DN17594_c0_g1_i1.p1  ORF type:complete len:357 (-),score=73.05 TRINITY_DN17594_c0_g1_i1:139-1167(-)